jgi:hypothetical protein
VTADEIQTTFHQAKVFMHAGISSSMAGMESDAIKFFKGAQSRFRKLKNTTDASIAQGWIEGIRERQKHLTIPTL